MNKLIYLLFLLFSFSVLSAQEKLSKKEKERREKNIQSGNPFKNFGYKAKVATLSNGKYLEFHDLDSIVTIGTVRWHVNKNLIVGRIVPDSLNPDAQPIGDRAGRWISPDPLSEEFPSWSPYTFCNNNPLFFTDLTGMSAEPPVNGLDYFRDDTGEYFWNKGKNTYEHYADPKKNGSNSFQGYFSANEFSEPIGNYNIIFDLSNAKPKDNFNKNLTITAISDPLESYLNTRSIIDDVEIKNIKTSTRVIYY